MLLALLIGSIKQTQSISTWKANLGGALTSDGTAVYATSMAPPLYLRDMDKTPRKIKRLFNDSCMASELL